jgi:protein-S-isoprenylcysteine O-methyltransferase Ste14
MANHPREEVSAVHIVDLVISVGWVAFWIYWLASAVGVKPGRARTAPYVGLRVGALLVILVLIRAGTFKGHPTGDPWLGGVGLTLFLVGLALAIWARLYLGRNWGMPMTQKDHPELVTTGPYGSVRHPIYTGILLAMIGTSIAVSAYWFIAVVAIGTYFIYSALAEERFMASRFPDTYPRYRQSTRMLIPLIW